MTHYEAEQLVVLAQYRSRAHDEQVLGRRDRTGLLFGDNDDSNEYQVTTRELFSFYQQKYMPLAFSITIFTAN